MSSLAELGYRMQDGCWNCAARVDETGPDGSTCLLCLQGMTDLTSTLSHGDIVHEAGICNRWVGRGKDQPAILRTID
jgi:hypothetical protein